ncbi:hypothetical protein OROHE_008270 [Orobanche hederae]
MDDDDEFGDLYTDVLRPLLAQSQPQREESAAARKASSLSQGRPIDLSIKSDDEENFCGAPDMRNPNPKSALGSNLNAPVEEKYVVEPKGFGLNLGSNSDAARIDGVAGNGGDVLALEVAVLEKGEGVKIPIKSSAASDIMGDDDINFALEDGENKDEDLVEDEVTLRNKEDDMYKTASQKENTINLVNKSVDDGRGLEQMIPGLSKTLENLRGSNCDDEWESEESEDDLQIVLNDNIGPMVTERMIDEDDEGGEPLVIVADNGDVGPHHQQLQMIMEEPVWGSQGVPEADGEKNLGNSAKTSGGVVGSVASASMLPKIACDSPLYHHPLYSQFKYVRPGAAPLPAAASGGIPGQVRPPVSMGPPDGRGRGDWRPAGIKGPSGMQKGFHSGYGMPAWAANTAGRGYGSGMDFTLPSHKTIFEVDIDNFEDKPWKLPGIDVSDFFNFGMNEGSWRDYCKQLDHLRLEKTMQSKIHVYESGRMEQDYDPDLPPALTAAVGIQDVPSENAKSGKADAGPTDLARENADGRPALPVGRPILVEASSGDRLPSADTRRPRFHDIDAIIEIVCQSSTDGDDMDEQQDNVPEGKDLGGHEIDDLHQDDKDDTDSVSSADNNGHKREAESRIAQSRNTLRGDEMLRDNILESLGVSSHYQSDREIGLSHEESDSRSTKGRGHVRLLTKTAAGNNRGEHIMDDQNEESLHSEDGKPSPTLSSSCTIGSDSIIVGKDMNDESLMDDRSIDTQREEMAVDVTSRGDGNLRQKFSSYAEQFSQQDDDGEDSQDERSGENRKSRSRSNKDKHRRLPDDAEDEVHQDWHLPAFIRKQVGDDDDYYAPRKGCYERDKTGRNNMVAKGREDFFSGRRIRVEDLGKRELRTEFGSRNWDKFRESDRSEKDEHHQSRNQLDNGSWREASHDHDVVRSRQRDRGSNSKSLNKKVDDLHSKRRKEETHKSWEYAGKEDDSHNNRGSSSRSKRDRGDGSVQLKIDEQTRLQDDDLHYARQNKGGSFQTERSERRRERDEWYRREREETRSVMRSELDVEDKTWVSHSRGKDNYKGSNREYNKKDAARHGDEFKRRDRVENGIISQRGYEDTYARGNHLCNDDKKARYERPSGRDGRVAYLAGTSRMIGHKRKEDSSRKNKESESGDRSSLIPGGQISETVNLRGRTEQQSGEVSRDDEQQPNSGKGRSKLERWVSHNERGVHITSMPSSSFKSKNLETHKSDEASVVSKQPPEESSKKVDKPQPSVDEKVIGAEINNINPKVDEDKHLDTVEKLKKRSERFKLPMPSEKDAISINKMESEPLPLAQTEIHPDIEIIKSERPPRKRSWTGK